jgi:hypothetical protein
VLLLRNSFGTNPDLYDFNYLLTLPQLNRFAMPLDPRPYGDVIKNFAIQLLNTDKIELVSENKNWPPLVDDNTDVLVKARGNDVLKVIDFAINIDSVDMILNKFRRVKQISLYIDSIDNSIVNKIYKIVNTYKNLTITIHQKSKNKDVNYTTFINNLRLQLANVSDRVKFV